MLRKAVDECAPRVLTTLGPNDVQRMDVIVAPCYERLWFCTPRCHQLWAILWPHFGPCYERQMHYLYIIRSMLRKAALPGATKYWAILWPHKGSKYVLGRKHCRSAQKGSEYAICGCCEMGSKYVLGRKHCRSGVLGSEIPICDVL